MMHNADTAHTSHAAKTCAFCLRHVRKLNDGEEKKNYLLQGICTHGHPP